jgi:hypothetical protein
MSCLSLLIFTGPGEVEKRHDSPEQIQTHFCSFQRRALLNRYSISAESNLTLQIGGISIWAQGSPGVRIGAVRAVPAAIPGIALAEDTGVPPDLVSWLASRLAVSAEAWAAYGEREETRREHGREIRAHLGISGVFGIADFRQACGARWPCGCSNRQGPAPG